MSTVEQIELAIEKLPTAAFFKLAERISSKFADAWDREIEVDIREGKLNTIAEAALTEFRAGKTPPFPPNEE